MLGSIKALIVVLAIAAIVFQFAKPIALRFMSAADFSRRRHLWFVLTALGFLSPNIWLYALIAVPLLVRAARIDPNPIALYLLMLHVIPPIAVSIPILGNSGLFPLDNYRLLAFCVLLPAVMRYRKNPGGAMPRTFGAMDVFLLAFGVLQVALYTAPDLPHHYYIPDSPTNAARRAVLFLLDTYLPYFAVSRLSRSRQEMVDAVASFCLACAVLAAIAMFERTRNWLLYVNIAAQWSSDPNAGYYLSRGGSVRAQASAGHSIALGYLIVIAFGFWLYLRSHIEERMRRIGGAVLFWGGLFGAFSRGGWVGGMSVYLAFSAVGPRAMSRVLKGVAVTVAIAGLIALSPLGDQVMALLPATGKPADNYRDLLSKRGWELVFAHPFFGDQFPWPAMEDLRQGEGIIDIVNTYLGVALNYGFVGLFFFVGFILLGMMNVYVHARKLAHSDPDLALFGACLLACIVGTLIMIDSSSFIFGCQKMFYVLAGLTAAYVRVGRASRYRPAEANAGTAPQE
jgi:hypothetical protein